MNRLYFKSNKEVIYFCEKLLQMHKEVHFTWKKDKIWGNVLKLNDNKITYEEMIECLTAVFMYFRLHKMIDEIIKDIYFYTNDAEIDKISEITQWIIKEKSYAQLLFPSTNKVDDYVATLFATGIVDEQLVYFDSIATFSMKPLTKLLIEAVAYAIDELRREEDYQSFLETIRTHLQRRETKIEELFILQGEDFAFFNRYGKMYSETELKSLMKKEPLYIYGLDENEMNLSPVITLSPEYIYIYGNDPADAKTLSIINLFQERVRFFARDKFPFPIENKNG